MAELLNDPILEDGVFISIVGLLVLYFIFKVVRYYYIKHKYKVCPKCGHNTFTTKEIEYIFGDQETHEIIRCKNFDQNCGWKFTLKF